MGNVGISSFMMSVPYENDVIEAEWASDGSLLLRRVVESNWRHFRCCIGNFPSGNKILVACVLSLIVLGLLCSQAAAQTSAAQQRVPASPSLGKPIGYWSFDQADIAESKAFDRSGNSHVGTIDGARSVAGKVGEALAFKGSDGLVTQAMAFTIDGLAIKGTELSVSLWLKKDTLKGGIRRLIFFHAYTQVAFIDSKVCIHTGQPAKTDFRTPLAEAGIEPGRWYHLVVTWDTTAPGENVKVYVDGRLKLATNLEKARGTQLHITRMIIASDGTNPWPQPSQVFAGAVDEVALYDTALTAQEIHEYFSAVVKAYGPEPPVAAKTVPLGEVIRMPPEALYVPKVTYSGPKKLIRLAEEVLHEALHIPSLADIDLASKVKLWQDRGLDGLVFSFYGHGGDPWGLKRLDYQQFIPDIKAFQSVKDWGRLTDNFNWSVMAARPAHTKDDVQDWFKDDDWDIILSNARVQAKVAKECGFKGMVLDTEQYDGRIPQGAWYFFFSYPYYVEYGYKVTPEPKPRPFPEVAAKVRQRGTQYARAICSAFPGIRLMVLPGLYEETQHRGTGPLEQNHAGLFPSFIDGLLLGLDEEATLIAGSEPTYHMTTYRDIIGVRQSYDQAIEQLCKAPAHLKSKMSFAVGIWPDQEEGGWSNTDVSVNVRDPQTHLRALRNAFRASGEYAWLYGQQSRFLTIDPTPLQREYFQANIDAHQLEELNTTHESK